MHPEGLPARLSAARHPRYNHTSKATELRETPLMVLVKRLVLDVLKPHKPNGLEFAKAIAEHGLDYRVNFTVQEVDEKTETVQIIIEGKDIDFDGISDTIANLGGSLHSIDQVEVISAAPE